MGMRTDLVQLPHVLIRESITFHPARAQPTEPAESTYTFHTEAETDPYVRTTVRVDILPRKIELGWVESPSVLWIQNLEGTDRQTIPTAEEMETINSRVIELYQRPELSHLEPFARIRPGHSVRFEPAGDVYIGLPLSSRDQDRPAKIMIVALPQAVDPKTITARPSAGEGVVVESGSVIGTK